MTGYLYTRVNRLETPHSYMYTPFEGAAFFKDYFADRKKVMCLCGISENALPVESVSESIRDLLPIIEAKSRYYQLHAVNDAVAPLQSLSSVNVDKEVNTHVLLWCLLNTQMAGDHGEAVKLWLDRLTQRFEVSKKLFDSYLPGFRKGTYKSKQAGPYWMLGLALCLFYADTGRIKYLSTQLKITDLLCSLPLNVVECSVPIKGLGLLLCAEVKLVRQLLAQKEIQGDS